MHTAAALRARRRGPAAGAQQAPAGTAGPSSHPDSSPSPGNSPPPGAAARASSNPAGDPGPNPGHNPGVGPLGEEVDGFGEYEPGAFEDSEDFGDSVDLEGMELEVEEGDEEDDALPDLAAIGPTIDTGDTDWCASTGKGTLRVHSSARISAARMHKAKHERDERARPRVCLARLVFARAQWEAGGTVWGAASRRGSGGRADSPHCIRPPQGPHRGGGGAGHAGPPKSPIPTPCRRGPVAVEVAQGVLDTPAMASLELFLLRARSRQKFLEIRLDQVPLQWPEQALSVLRPSGHRHQGQHTNWVFGRNNEYTRYLGYMMMRHACNSLIRIVTVEGSCMQPKKNCCRPCPCTSPLLA